MGKKFTIQSQQLWRHIKTGNLYYTSDLVQIKLRNLFFKRVWVEGVIYHSNDSATKIYARTLRDFRKHFEFVREQSAIFPKSEQ